MGRSLGDGVLAAEAACWLTLARVALRGFRFARVAALAARPWRSSPAPLAPAGIDRIAWAVEAAARRAPWRPACFERGLAAHAMLRSRGAASVLCYGARGGDTLGPSAHVWVRVGDRNVVGGEEAPRFALLATFPPEDAAP